MAEDSAVWNGIVTGHAATTDVWSAPYSSLEFSNMLSTLLGSDSSRAYVIPTFGNNLRITQNTPAAMNVLVDTGRAFLRGKLYANASQKTLTIGTADATNPRLDRIVLRITFASQTVQVVILAGSAAATPSLPALTQDATTYEIALGYVWVAANATTITNAEIHDERVFAPSFEGLRIAARNSNRINNSEFLASITARTYPPAQWNLVSTPSAIATATKPSQMVRGNAIQITADGADEGISQTVVVKSSTTYSIKLLYNVTAGDTGSVVVTDNGSTPATITRNLKRTGAWLEETILYTTPSDASTVTISLRATASTDIVQFGQVLLVEGYLPGSYRAISPTATVELLDEIELTATATSLVFNIPTDYKHLRIVISGRLDYTITGTYTVVGIRFNGDSTAVYDRGDVTYNGTSWADDEVYAGTLGALGYLPNGNAPASTRGTIVAWLPDYREATLLQAVCYSGSGIRATVAPGFFVNLGVSRWRTAAAITSVTLIAGGGNFVVGTRISIYGYR